MYFDTVVVYICHDIFNFIQIGIGQAVVAGSGSSKTWKFNYINIHILYKFLTFLEPMMSHGTKMTFGVSDARLHSVSIWVFFPSWKCGVTGWTQGGTPALKVSFFQKVRFVFLNLQISKKKYSKKLSWAWNLNFPPITVKCYWREISSSG